MKRKTSSTIICENFKIPHQTIFQDYKCSFKSGLTYFGRLYVGEQHVCFIANMFGILKKCVIQIEKIEKLLQPSKLCLLIQQKESQSSTTVQYNFSGFKTDHAYTLIKALWKKQKIQSEVLNSNDDEQIFSSIVGGPEVNKQKFLDQGNVESSFFNPKAVEQKQKLCEFQLPCSVQQYYSFFLADNATVYPRKKHIELKDAKQITVTPWRKSQQLDSQVRQISAVIRVVGVPFMNYAHLNQVWKLKRNQKNEIFLEFVTQMGDVPYSNYFVVNNYWTILKDGDTKCKMQVQMSFIFNKSTYMKNTILTRTSADMMDDCNFWFKQVKEILQKMRKSQEIQSSKSIRYTRLSRNASSDIQFESNDVSTEQKFISPKRKNSYSSTLRQGEGSKTLINNADSLSKKIDKLTKLVIVLIILVLIQVVFSGYSLLTKEPIYYSFSSIDKHQHKNDSSQTHVIEQTQQKVLDENNEI